MTDDSYVSTQNSEEYKKALKAVGGLSQTNQGTGFVVPEVAATTSLQNNSKVLFAQNNALIQLIVTQARQISELTTKVDQLVALIKGKAPAEAPSLVNLPSDILESLTSKISGLTLESTQAQIEAERKRQKEKKAALLYHTYKNPYTILKEERQRK